MKAQNTILAMMLIALMAMLGTACSSDSSPAAAEPATRSVRAEEPIEVTLNKSTPEELEAYYASLKNGEQMQGVSVTYEADLCPDEAVTGEVKGRYTSPDLFVFYRFKATAGQTVTINVNKTECDLDAGMTLCRGVATTTTGVKWSNQYWGSTELTYLTRNDDENNSESCPTGCGMDPEITYDITVSGWYTVLVYRTGTCNGTTDDEFEIVVTGNDECSTDADGDGYDDDEDEYPESDTRAEVQIDGCDSGVDNIAVGNGAYMMDILNYCAENAGNHGEYVSCVNYYANEWKAAGLISGNEKASIGSCASGSSLP